MRLPLRLQSSHLAHRQYKRKSQASDLFRPGTLALPIPLAQRKYVLCVLQVLLPMLLFQTGLAQTATKAEPVRSELRWKSGGNLPGYLVDANATHIRWKSPLFDSPLELEHPYLESVEFPESEVNGPAGPLRFRTQTGDVVYGQLLDVTADRQVVISGQRHGQFKIPLTALRSFRRFDDPAMAYFGPTGTTGWKTLSVARFTSDWKRNADNEISTSVYAAELFRDLKLGDLAEIDVSLRWGRRPGFLITFVNPDALRLSQDAVRLETRGNELILQTLSPNGNAQVIARLSKQTNSIELRLIWNQLTGQLAVYSMAGKILGKIKAGPSGSRGHSGLFIRNRGSDLTIVHLRVNDEGGQSAVRLSDGEIVYGNIHSFDKEAQVLILEDRSGELRRFPLKSVAVGYLGDASDDPPPQDEIQLGYFDGTLLRGKLLAVQDGTIQIRTAYSAEPISARLEGAQELLFQSPSPQPRHLASLELPGAKLHGRLAPVSGSDLGWEALGSTQALPFPKSGPARFVQDLMERARHSRGPLPKDVLYLTNGDVIRCEVKQIDQSHLLGATIFSESTRLPVASIKAIDFNSSPQRAKEPGGARRVPAATKNAFLTLPRLRRDHPPTHALAAKNGDWLRGRLLELSSEAARLELPLEEITIPRSRLASIVWLQPPTAKGNGPAPDSAVAETKAVGSGPEERGVASLQAAGTSVTRAELVDGSQLTFAPSRLTHTQLFLAHSTLGERQIPLHTVRELQVGQPRQTRAATTYSDWTLTPAKDPLFVAAANNARSDDPIGIGKRSPLVGSQAKPIVASLLDGSTFKLNDWADKVVVLDFWATWCAPCVVALPQTAATVQAFAAEKVAFVAVNQQQEPANIRKFLELRGMDFTVALDPESKIANQFDVRAIPQTVIIGRGGIIERLYVGDVPGLQGLIKESLEELLQSEGVRR